MNASLLVDKLKRLKPIALDDFVDRLHYQVSTAILLFFTLFIGSEQIFKDPISCMMPADFDRSLNEGCPRLGPLNVLCCSLMEQLRAAVLLREWHLSHV